MLLVKPTAGGGRARIVAFEAAQAIRALGREIDVRVTTARGDVERMAREAAASGVERLLVCGGDGTVHEAVNGLAGTGTALGILPGGRGNDLAATLGVPIDPAAAARHLVANPIRRIDLGVVNGRRFGTTAGVGFDADVAMRTNRGVWRRAGRFAYLGGIVASLVAMLLGLAVLNPEAYAAERNVQRYQQTGRIDLYYLAALSADATPALSALPFEERRCALSKIVKKLADPDPWYGWNIARDRAREVLASLDSGAIGVNCRSASQYDFPKTGR